MKQSLVSCIVVTHNSEEYIQNCLKSLQKITYPNIEIIVVDNASKDKTVEIVKQFAKEVKVFPRKKNDGYAGGNSFGIAKSSGQYFLLLNPDTIVSPGVLEPLISLLNTHDDLAAVQPQVFLQGEKDQVNLTGKVTHYLGFDWLRDYRSEKARKSGEILSVSGSCILLRKTAYEEVGGLDPSYFMYYEDTDLSWRLRLNGYRLWYCAESNVYHDYKFRPVESYQPFAQKLFWAERNRLYTMAKNYEFSTIVLILPAFLATELALLIYFALKGWLLVKLKTYWSLWQSRDHILETRKAVQDQRKRADRDIARHFETKIDFVFFRNPILTYVLNPLLHVYWRIIWPLV